MTRLEKHLIATASKRARFRERISKAETGHKATAALRARLVDATTEQLRAENRMERRRA